MQIFYSNRNLLSIPVITHRWRTIEIQDFWTKIFFTAHSILIKFFQGASSSNNNTVPAWNLRTNARNFSSLEWNESRFHILPATPIEIFFPTGYIASRHPLAAIPGSQLTLWWRWIRSSSRVERGTITRERERSRVNHDRTGSWHEKFLRGNDLTI